MTKTKVTLFSVYISLFTSLNFEKGCSQYIRIFAGSAEAGKIANNNNQASIFIHYMKDCMSKIHHGLGYEKSFPSFIVFTKCNFVCHNYHIFQIFNLSE